MMTRAAATPPAMPAYRATFMEAGRDRAASPVSPNHSSQLEPITQDAGNACQGCGTTVASVPDVRGGPSQALSGASFPAQGAVPSAARPPGNDQTRLEDAFQDASVEKARWPTDPSYSGSKRALRCHASSYSSSFPSWSGCPSPNDGE